MLDKSMITMCSYCDTIILKLYFEFTQKWREMKSIFPREVNGNIGMNKNLKDNKRSTFTFHSISFHSWG